MGGTGEVTLLGFCFRALACEVSQLWPQHLVPHRPRQNINSSIKKQLEFTSYATYPLLLPAWLPGMGMFHQWPVVSVGCLRMRPSNYAFHSPCLPQGRSRVSGGFLTSLTLFPQQSSLNGVSFRWIAGGSHPDGLPSHCPDPAWSTLVEWANCSSRSW